MPYFLQLLLEPSVLLKFDENEVGDFPYDF